MKRIALTIALLAGVLWLVWPYFTAYSIGQAINNGDTVALEARVSWPSFRQGIKDDLNVVFAHSLSDAQQADKGMFGGLLAAFVPVMVDKMVDAYMTPPAFATLLRERNPKLGAQVSSPNGEKQKLGSPNGQKEKLRIENVKYAFFTGPTSFLIVLGDHNGKDDTRLDVLMQFQDFGWKVTRVYLPVKKMLVKRDEFKTLMGEAGKKPTPPVDEPGQGRSSPAGEIANRFLDGGTARKGVNAEYINKVTLYDFQARYMKTTLGERVPGVTFKLKNEGNKTLKRVEVTVYFKDGSGNIITEETYTPVLVSSFSFAGGNKPLKPGYIWQIESGTFYAAKSVPSEWAEGRAEAKITSVEIQDE